ncbi:MAG: cytochrome c family protein [Alphaproteobacteria bacterium]|nr:cytochrome c family protein [Alphaproteobacteria bacterium]
MFRTLLAVAMIAAVPTLAAAEGDAAAGEKVFRKCKACHTADEAKNKVGPHLVGIVGRKAGAVEDFKYSDAMKNSGLTWDEATLKEYLADPKAKIPGNKMIFAGLKKAEDLADIVAYLSTKK